MHSIRFFLPLAFLLFPLQHASAAPAASNLDLRQLVELKLVTIQTNVRSAGTPRYFLYEFDAIPSPELIERYGGSRKMVQAELRAGTIIEGSGPGTDVVVAADQNVYFNAGQTATIRGVAIYALEVNKELPSGDLKLKPVMGEGRYLLFDDSQGRKRTPGGVVAPHHLAKQVAIMKHFRGFSSSGWNAVYINSPRLVITDAVNDQADGFLTRARAKRQKDAALVASLKPRMNSDPVAMIAIAQLYLAGARGLPQDNLKAVEWYTKAAQAGSAHAKHQLGLLYSKPVPPGRDPQKALGWLKAAAEDDFAPAMIALGDIHRNGWGSTAKNETTARSWYEKAGAKGEEAAQKRIAALDSAPSRQAAGFAALGIIAVWLTLGSGQDDAGPPPQRNSGMIPDSFTGGPVGGVTYSQWEW